MGFGLKKIKKKLKKAVTKPISDLKKPIKATKELLKGNVGSSLRIASRDFGQHLQKAAPYLGLIPGFGTAAGAVAGAAGSALSGDDRNHILKNGIKGAVGGYLGSAAGGAPGIFNSLSGAYAGLGGAGTAGAGGSGSGGGFLSSLGSVFGEGSSVPGMASGGGIGGASSGGYFGSLGNILGGSGGSGMSGIFSGSNLGGLLGGALGGVLGNQSSKDLKTTSVSELPDWQRPYVQAGLAGAADLYGAGAPTVAPLSAITLDSISKLSDPTNVDPYKRVQSYLEGTLGKSASPEADAYYKSVLDGDYLGANPYLDATFDKAARGITSNVDSLYASGGRLRSGAASRGLATALGDASTDLYGKNYEAERDRQGQAAAGSASLGQANQNYGLNAANGINAAQNGVLNAYGLQANAGGILDQQAQRYIDEPFEQLSRYLGSVTGNYGGTQTNVQPQNRTLNTLGGAVGGYSLGSSLFGGASGTPANTYNPSQFNFGGSAYGGINAGNPNGMFSGGLFG